MGFIPKQSRCGKPDKGIEGRFWCLPAGSFNVDNFFATEAALNFVMMEYNLMSLFRQVILNTKTHQQLKTLHYKVFAIGSYIKKDGNSRILKLSLAIKQRSWFEGLWSSINLFSCFLLSQVEIHNNKSGIILT